MGWKLKSVDVNLKPNEERDIDIILVPEKRAAIHGVVRLPNGTPVKNALVKLFKKDTCDDNCELIPITFAFTDECGQFLFGVPANVELVIKVFYYRRERKPCDRDRNCDYDHYGNDHSFDNNCDHDDEHNYFVSTICEN